MQLGRTFRDGGAGDVDAFLDRVRVRAFLSRTLVETAELAVGYADVCMVEVSVDVVVGRQAMLPSSDVVGGLADSVEIGRIVEREALVKG